MNIPELLLDPVMFAVELEGPDIMLKVVVDLVGGLTVSLPFETLAVVGVEAEVMLTPVVVVLRTLMLAIEVFESGLVVVVGVVGVVLLLFKVVLDASVVTFPGDLVVIVV